MFSYYEGCVFLEDSLDYKLMLIFFTIYLTVKQIAVFQICMIEIRQATLMNFAQRYIDSQGNSNYEENI